MMFLADICLFTLKGHGFIELDDLVKLEGLKENQYIFSIANKQLKTGNKLRHNTFWLHQLGVRNACFQSFIHLNKQEEFDFGHCTYIS